MAISRVLASIKSSFSTSFNRLSATPVLRTMSTPQNDASDKASTAAPENATLNVASQQSMDQTTEESVGKRAIQTTDQDPSTAESAAKRSKSKIEAEDTSSYLGPKRDKVRGNIRGAE
ncbi:hypothetical protein BGZ58_006038, partial [Dissophora ornata]